MRKMNSKKIKEWLVRYTPSEIFGIITAYIGFYAAFKATENHLAASYVASLTENIGFYLPLLIKDLRQEIQSKRKLGVSIGAKGVFFVCLGILAECGPGELLDSLFLRPLAISYATSHMGPEWGVLVGKIIGDIFFYVPAILIYEYRKHLKARYTV